MREGESMSTVTFFKNAKKLLANYGHEDASFYFEQVEEHIQKGGSIMSDDSTTVGRILGI